MSKPDKARHYTIARGSAMESASHLDVMKVGGLLDDEQYARGIELLERVVAMLTKQLDGTLTLACEGGTTLTLAFPLPPSERAGGRVPSVNG